MSRISLRRWRPLTALMSGLLGASALTAVTAPAKAYSPNPTVRYAIVNTTSGSCDRIAGTLAISQTSSGCYLDDSFDQTLFQWDAGGEAMKVQLYNSSGTMVGKVEFHPLDEKLWVYDTANDSDTFYVGVHTSDQQDFGLYRGPVNGANIYDLDIAEGAAVYLYIYDDSSGTDVITNLVGTA